MNKAIITTIDEEFEKGRGPDLKPRKRLSYNQAETISALRRKHGRTESSVSEHSEGGHVVDFSSKGNPKKYHVNEKGGLKSV